MPRSLAIQAEMQIAVFWNFGHTPWVEKLILYQIAANRNLQRSKIHDTPNFRMIHDFIITDKSWIFLIQPFRYDQDHAAGARSFLDMHRSYPDQAVDNLSIDKSTLEITRRHEIAPRVSLLIQRCTRI